MCQQGAQTLNLCPLQSWHHPSKQRRLTFAVENHWVAAGGGSAFVSAKSVFAVLSLVIEKQTAVIWSYGVVGKNIYVFSPVSWVEKKRVASYWLTKLSNQVKMSKKKCSEEEKCSSFSSPALQGDEVCLLKCKAIVSGKTCSRYLKRCYVAYSSSSLKAH